MANYCAATVFPSIEELRRDHIDQLHSGEFAGDALSICERAGIHVEDLTLAVTEYLASAEHPGIEDLSVLMDHLNMHFHLGLKSDNQRLYKLVKALPHFSGGRIGYTHRRRAKGLARGVFVFLFY